MSGDGQSLVRFERRFDVDREKVFDTLTKPDQMLVWWGDDAEIEVDLQVGGRWTIVRREDGVEYLATGEYLEVERPSLLKYTFGMPQFSPNSDTITITIDEEGDGSRVTFEHSGVDIASELRELKPGETSATEAGWQQGFDLMAAAWAGSA